MKWLPTNSFSHLLTAHPLPYPQPALPPTLPLFLHPTDLHRASTIPSTRRRILPLHTLSPSLLPTHTSTPIPIPIPPLLPLPPHHNQPLHPPRHAPPRLLARRLNQPPQRVAGSLGQRLRG